MDILAYRPVLPEEVSKMFTDHLESLIASGMEFDESEVRRYWAAAEVAASKKE